jgi:release factor glutamine methyltransferase
MLASEISEKASQLAVRNAISILGSADRLKVVRPDFASDVLKVFSGKKADFLISNPPYLDPSSPAETDAEVLKHEPASALFPQTPSGMAPDPLYFYREIASGALQLLNPGGSIFLEIASERADKILQLFEPLWNIQLISDLTGRPRVLIGVAKHAKE